MKRLLFAFLIGCEEPPPKTVEPLVIGDRFAIDSKILGETRAINVYRPEPCLKAACPVLYMPDGGLNEDFPHVMGLVDVSVKNETMRPFIVVGIPNTERRRDLVFASTRKEDLEVAPHCGGSGRFRDFIRTELKPEIAKRYRVTNESAIVGESFAGLFVVETFLLEPTLFDTYVAIDPSMWWNDYSITKVKPSIPPNKKIFFATGDSPEMQTAAKTLDASLTTEHHYEPMPAETHGTIFHGAAMKAFRLYLAPGL